MNLEQQAENEAPRRTRSRLEAHREAILALRRKRWTYGQITQWLNERGVATTLTSIYRFCEQAIARRPRGHVMTPANHNQLTDELFSIPTPQITNKQTTNQERTPSPHRFNLDI